MRMSQAGLPDLDNQCQGFLTVGSPLTVAGSQSWAAVAPSARIKTQHRLREFAMPPALQTMHTSQDSSPGVLQTLKALA